MTADDPAPPATVLVIRVWIEPGHDSGFRARLLAGDAADLVPIRAVTSPEQVVDAVRGWLAEWVGWSG